MLVDVVDRGIRDKILHTHVSSNQEPHLRATDIVDDYLANDVNILLPPLEFSKSSLNLGAGSLKGEDAIVSKNVVQIFLVPDARGHCLDQIESGEKNYFDLLASSISTFDASQDFVNFVLEMIQNAGLRRISKQFQITTG